MKVSALIVSFFSIILYLMLICRCNNPAAAGGTTDTGNSKIAAVIYTNDGQRAAGAKVILTPATYIPTVIEDSTSIRDNLVRETVTDDSGRFSLSLVDTGEFFIEINDMDSSAVLMDIQVPSVKGTFISLTDTLREHSAVEGSLGSVTDSIRRFLLIYGIDRKVQIGNDGLFTVRDLPAGTFHLRIISENNEFVPVDFDSISLYPSQILKLPVVGWNYNSKILLNTTISGADIPQDVYNFPLLIKLTEENFNFTQVKGNGSDCKFIDNNYRFLSHEIEIWDSINQQAFIWVLIDTILGNNDKQTFNMVWGNPQAKPDESLITFDTANGFFGSYHFNGNLDDATVNNYDGTDSGTIDVSKGIIGRGRGFDGSRSFIGLGDLPDRSCGTISFWFKLSRGFDFNSAVTQGIWGKKTSDSIDFNISLRGSDYYTDISSTPGLTGSMITKQEFTEYGYYLESGKSTFTAGIWYFGAWCYGSEGSYLYINGVLEDSSSDTGTIIGDADDEIGRSLYDASNIVGGSPRYFNGVLDEFRIDKKFRDENWIKLCYINQGKDDRLVQFQSLK